MFGPRLATACVPTWPVVKKADNTIHPHVEQECACDPANYTGSVRARVATEFVLVTEALVAAGGLEAVQCANCLLMHARADTYVEPGGSVAFFERVQCNGAQARRLGAADLPFAFAPERSLALSRAPARWLSASHLPSSSLKALLLFGADGADSELRTAGPPTAQKELEALSKINMWHALTQEPGAERLAAAAAKWVCACVPRVGAKR